MMVTVCKDCQERYVGCHSKCEKYIKQKEEERIRTDKEFKDKCVDHILIDLYFNRRNTKKRK